MLNLLLDYISQSINLHEAFQTNFNLTKKVNEEGKLLPYYGNTIVFTFDASLSKKLKKIQDELYEKIPTCLAEALIEESFHLTLHDLYNDAVLNDELKEAMHISGTYVNNYLKKLESKKIHLKATWVFNMVNTSIVLGLRPSDADSEAVLTELYEEFEKIKPLNYAYTPHITLAYYKPGTYDPNLLNQVMKEIDLEITLDTKDLRLQHFENMNYYF